MSELQPAQRHRDHRESGLKKTLAGAVALLLVFSVFSFAASEDWSATICEVSIFALFGFVAYRDPSILRPPRRLWAPFALVLVLIGVGVLQLIPLPTVIWNGFHAERSAIYAEGAKADALLRTDAYVRDPFAPARNTAGEGASANLHASKSASGQGTSPSPQTPAWLPATFAPSMTLRAVVALAAALGLILLFEKLYEDDKRYMRVLAMVAGLSGLAVGLIALVQYRGTGGKIMGIRESAYAANAFGPFVNENTGIAFLNTSLCLLYYLIWRRIGDQKRNSNKVGLSILLAGLVCFHLTVLFIRTSEVGLWIVMLFPAVILLRLMRNHPRASLAAGTAAALIGAGVLMFAVHYRLSDFHGRIEVWRNTARQEHWLVGNGLQSFSVRFPATFSDLPATAAGKRWYYAENEYLQLYFEAGSIGLLAALSAGLFVLVLGVKVIRRNGQGVVLVPALWGEALHALTDFQFHFWPVVIVTLIVIALLCTSAERHKRSRHEGSTPLNAGDPPEALAP